MATTPAQGRIPLTEYLAVQQTADGEIARVLELAARQASSRIRKLKLNSSFSAGVRAAQLSETLAAIVKQQNEAWTGTGGVGPIIVRNLPKAQRAAENAFELIEQVVVSVFGESRGEELVRSFRQTARAGLELDRVRRARTLSPRVYRAAALTSGRVERQIRAGIVQGLSPRELADSVEQFISPRTPGGASYAAMRLARTELNNAFHEAQKTQGEAPWVKAMVWNLSKTHPSKNGGKKDACDRYAVVNLHGLGRGKYPADQIPDKPHPQCMCFTTYDLLSEGDMLDRLPELINQRLAIGRDVA